MSETIEPARKMPLPFRLLGWIFGSLSLLNLIRDTTPVELYGLLQEWIAAYALFVEKIGGFLFGWINWSWLKIDNVEMHVIVISFILGSTWGRAVYSSIIARGAPVNPIAGLLSMFTTAVLLFFLIVLLIPSPWGARIGFGLEATYFLWAAFKDDKNLSRASDFRRELGIVLAGVAILLVVNYMIFKPS